jgi:hypothetical protein
MTRGYLRLLTLVSVVDALVWSGLWWYGRRRQTRRVWREATAASPLVEQFDRPVPGTAGAH